MMRHDRNEPANERLDRYADAIHEGALTCQRPHESSAATTAAHRMPAVAVMAVADAEQAELRAELADSEEEVARQYHEAQAAEAEVERLRAEIRDRESERDDLRDRAQKAEAGDHSREVRYLRALLVKVEALADYPPGDCEGAPCIWPEDLRATLHTEDPS